MRFSLRTLLICSISLVSLLALVIFLGKPTIVIDNRSNRQVRQLRVEIVSEGDAKIQDSMELLNIAPRAQIQKSFRSSGDDCYLRVEGWFADGEKISGGGGYFTSGMTKVLLVIDESGEVDVK